MFFGLARSRSLRDGVPVVVGILLVETMQLL